MKDRTINSSTTMAHQTNYYKGSVKYKLVYKEEIYMTKAL